MSKLFHDQYSIIPSIYIIQNIFSYTSKSFDSNIFYNPNTYINYNYQDFFLRIDF